MVSATPRAAGRTGAHVGVALSATELCVSVWRGTAAPPSLSRIVIDQMNGENGGGWPSLTSALREIASRHGGADAIDVTLMPGLAEVRRLELPPMRADDLRQLLTRNAARYFAGARGPQFVGALAAQNGVTGTPSHVVAAAAPARLVTAIHAAAAEAGCRVASVSAAEGAWTAAAVSLWPAFARGTAHVLVLHDDRTDLLQLEEGHLAGVRRFRAGAADEALIAEALGMRTRDTSETRDTRDTRDSGIARSSSSSAVAAVGRPDLCIALSRALATRGVTVGTPPAEWADAAERPDSLAAAFAGPGATPTLDTDDVLAARDGERRRWIRRAVAGAAGLLLLSALFEFWGVQRELNAVRAHRAAIKSDVSTTLVGRTSVETAFRQLATLNAEQRLSPRWSAVIAALGDRLNGDAYLTVFRSRGDSVLVDGLATHAARVFDEIERTPGLTGVRAAAPVRREAPSDGPAMERFTIAALLVPRARP